MLDIEWVGIVLAAMSCFNAALFTHGISLHAAGDCLRGLI
jgi:hypothetical protein